MILRFYGNQIELVGKLSKNGEYDVSAWPGTWD